MLKFRYVKGDKYFIILQKLRSILSSHANTSNWEVSLLWMEAYDETLHVCWVSQVLHFVMTQLTDSMTLIQITFPVDIEKSQNVSKN